MPSSDDEFAELWKRNQELLEGLKKEIKAEGDDPIDWIMMKRALHHKRMDTLTKCIDRGLWDRDLQLWENEVAIQHGDPDE